MAKQPRHDKKFPGRHKFVCDVDGITYYSEHKVVRWDGAVVHRDNNTSRHPQDKIVSRRDSEDIPNPQPETEWVFVDGACDITFGLVDENNNPIVTGEEAGIQVPPTAATF